MYAGCSSARRVRLGDGAPSAAGVIRALSISVVIDGLASAPAGLLDRHFRQDRRMIADQANIWLGAWYPRPGLGRAGRDEPGPGRIARAAVAVVL